MSERITSYNQCNMKRDDVPAYGLTGFCSTTLEQRITRQRNK